VFDVVESSIALPSLPKGSTFAALDVPEDAAGSFGLEGLSLTHEVHEPHQRRERRRH
jgi:hypothetical protein